MNVTMHGGPWDGLTVELPETVDKLVVIDDRGRVHRYETAEEWEVITPAGQVDAGAEMQLARNREDFDRELGEAIGSRWDDAI